MAKYVPMGNRIMDNAFLRDKNGNEYTGEALVLACLFHAKAKRNDKNVQDLQRLMNDPNSRK